MTTTFSNMGSYAISSFQSNYASAGMNAFTDVGYYAMIASKYQNAILTGYDFYE